MHKSKLFILISALHNDEWIGLRDFLVYKKASPQVIILYKYLFQRRQNLDSKVLNINHVIQKSFDGMTRKNFQNLMSKLMSFVEDFLIIESLNTDPFERDLRNFQIYNDRHLYPIANRIADQLKVNWYSTMNLDLKNIDYLRRLQHAHFFSENPIKYQRHNTTLKDLIKSTKEFELIYNELYDLAKDISVSLNLVEKKELTDIKLNDKEMVVELKHILKSINNLNRNNDQKAFEYLYKKLDMHRQMSAELKSLVFGICESYLIKVISKGETIFKVKNLFNLYRKGLEKDLILYNNSISIIKFHKIVSIACISKEFDWADDFVKKCIKAVPQKHRKDGMRLSKIQIHFGKCEYSEALNLLKIKEMTNFHYNLLSRWHSLSIYFITHDNHGFIVSRINSFNKYFNYHQNRVSARNFNGSLNLAKIFKAAIKQKDDFNLKNEKAKYKNIVFKNRLESIFEQRRIYKEENNINL